MDFNLQEECQNLIEVGSYTIPGEIDVSSLDPGAVDSTLEDAIEALANSPENITDPNVFDVYRSYLKYSGSLNAGVMNKLHDSVSSMMGVEIEAAARDMDSDDHHILTAHKTPLEMYAFLINWISSAAEAVKTLGEEGATALKPKRGRAPKTNASSRSTKKKNSWSWADQIPATLSLLTRVLKLNTSRLWTSTAERDTFISCVTRPAYYVAENEVYMKTEKIRLAVYKVICLAVKNHSHGFAAQIQMMQDLQYFEHLSEPVAEILNILENEFDHTQLADEILREVAKKSFNAQDTKGPRTYSRFLIRLGELSPRLILKQISLLLAHLDSEAYPMRMAIVENIGHMIKYLTTSDDEKRDKKINSLFDLLIERFLDVNSYVRAKVFNVIIKLCDLPHKFPKRRLEITERTVGALNDKSSSVRRYAIALLTKLILTHPYGIIHGGDLNAHEWQERYREVAAELTSLEQRPVDEGASIEEEEDEGDGEEDESAIVKDPGVTVDEDGEIDMNTVDGTATSARTKTSKGSKRARKSKSTARHSYASDSDMDADETLMPDRDEAGDGDRSVSALEEGDDAVEEDQMDEDEVAEQILDVEGVPATPSRQSNKVKSAKGSTAKTPKAKGTVKKKPRKSEQLNLNALSQEQLMVAEMEGSKIQQLKLQRKYYADALALIRWLDGAAPDLCNLLGSTSKAEVLEAMEYFRVAWEYRLDTAPPGIKKMIHLIWTKDNTSAGEDGKELKGIRAKLLECYRSLYFAPVPDLEPKQQVSKITKNMIELTFDATLAELTSLEELLKAMMSDGQIHHDVIKKLWQVYSTDKDISRQQRRGAIIILGMIAGAKRQIVTDRVDTLLNVGLGHRGKGDLTLARYTCIALQRLSGSVKKVKGSLTDKSVRLSMENAIFKKLQGIIEYPCKSKEWFGLAEQAINAIYLLGEQPDKICDDIIKNLTNRVFNAPPESAPSENASDVGPPPSPTAERSEAGDTTMDMDDAATATAVTPRPKEKSATTDMGDAFKLSQLVFLVGHVAIKHIVHLELIERELKRRKEASVKEKGGHSATSPQPAKDGVEELDQVAGNTEDEIGDLVQSIKEDEMMFSEQSLLADFGPMIQHICLNPKVFKNQVLRTSAALSLSKMMCVSMKFCESNLLLFLRMLETSRDPNIRSNIVIALGDIAVCFSTLIDENSDRLYKGLSDTDLIVKKDTLMVLTHLILNGMVKIKGQLGEMAKCVEDEDRRVSDLAKLFFKELSTKDNAIYNNIQDVISHLSVGPYAVDEEMFQSVMKYIFTFIEKDRQTENLVEKLCQRFRDTSATDEKQWRNIAFCLSLLPYKSEKSLKKLIEGLPFYQDKLREETVYARFTEILSKAKANKSANKPDNELKEFEKILADFKEQGEEDQALEKRVEVKKAVAKRKATRRAASKK